MIDSSRRSAWIDNGRVAVIAGVIVFHAAMTYALDFDWYYEERTASAATTVLLNVVLDAGALFGLGLLFLIAGMLSPRSLARKGWRTFVRDRLVRLGIPVAVYWLVIEPLTELIAQRAEGDPAAQDPVALWIDTIDDVQTGVMWFVATLLVFSIAYAAWRRARPAAVDPGRVLGWSHLVTSGVIIVVGSFVVRLVWEYGDSTPLGLNLWQWPQMATMFALGILAGERGWLDPMPAPLRRRCGRLAVAGWAGALAVPVVVLLGGAVAEFTGGLHVEALALPVVEATLSLGMSLWLVGWMQGHLSRQGQLARALGRASYGAYVIHPLLVVSLSAALRSVPVAAEIKLVAVAAVGIFASFIIAWLLTRIPAMGRIV